MRTLALGTAIVLVAGCVTAKPGRGFDHAPADAGSAVVVPIRTAGESPAVGLQLDLVTDPEVLELVGAETSAAAAGAGLRLTAAPLAGGAIRVVVFGTSLERLPGGELGVVRLNAVSRTGGGIIPARALIAVDGDGNELVAELRGGAVAVGGVR